MAFGRVLRQAGLPVGPGKIIEAVKAVESGPYGSFLDDGRPPILFERHIFHRQTGGRFASHPDISHKSAGNYGKGGAHQYTRLERAMKLDRQAALEAASWGAFQILGRNWAMLGYDSVDDLPGPWRGMTEIGTSHAWNTMNVATDDLRGEKIGFVFQAYNLLPGRKLERKV